MMRATLTCAALLACLSACSRWRSSAPEHEPASSLEDQMRTALTSAAEAREAAYTEALHPGTRDALRRVHLEQDSEPAFRREGRALFALDTPWHRGDSVLRVEPLHVAGANASAEATADATRCAGCHHRGGEGGAGSFADAAFFDAQGDDVTTARRLLPRALAGAALLELAARGHDDMHPFGWRPGRPRTLRDMVTWSVTTHLGAPATRDEIDALTTYIASLPPPRETAPHAQSLVMRAENGAAAFATFGCATCHAPALRVTSSTLALSGSRRLDVSSWLEPSADGNAWLVRPYSDLREHHLGGKLGRVVTPPLWGVASRGPYLHDGTASSLREAILAHEGEAQAARDLFAANQRTALDLELFLRTLAREPILAVP